MERTGEDRCEIAVVLSGGQRRVRQLRCFVQVLTIAAAVLAARPVSAQHRNPALVVTLEREGGVQLNDKALRALASDIETIWSPFVDVVVTTQTPTMVGLTENRVRLVITTRTLPSAKATNMGWIEFVDGEPRPEVTVSTTAVTKVIREGTVADRGVSTFSPRAVAAFERRALAVSAAHELGHYLLRTTQHDEDGLMRPQFTAEELALARNTDLRLEAAGIARLAQQRPAFVRQFETDLLP